MTAWIFQANPDRFDVDSYLAGTRRISWLVARESHAQLMAPGDRVFLWRAQGASSNPPSGFIASGRILDRPIRRVDDPEALEFWTDPSEAGENLRVWIDLDRVTEPTGVFAREGVRADPVLKDLPHLRMAQGTNWPLTPKQAARLEQAWAGEAPSGEVEQNRFGAISGIEVGTEFANRRELSMVGIHRPRQAGICGTASEGAESIVLSGGYEDDVDEGDVIIYTGQGGNDPNSGRQTADQEFTRGNKALALSKEIGIPVRVVRGADRGSPYAPATGYRYDGLFLVEDAWLGKGKSGFQVCRFRLVRQSTEPPVPGAGAAAEPGPTERRNVTTNSLVRDARLAKKVKDLHDCRCQACGTRLETWAGPYAVAAHIRGLGIPHNGPDVLENVLCLCPNCHVLFDNGGLTVGPDLRLLGLPGKLAVVQGHRVNPAHLEYHRNYKPLKAKDVRKHDPEPGEKS